MTATQCTTAMRKQRPFADGLAMGHGHLVDDETSLSEDEGTGSPAGAPLRYELGTPKPAVFALEAAQRHQFVFRPHDAKFLGVDFDRWAVREGDGR